MKKQDAPLADLPLLDLRYRRTLNLLKSLLPPPARILDLGTPNPFSEIMRREGYEVFNTRGEDLDDEPEAASRPDVDAVTAFEILEHLVAPYNVLRSIRAPRLIVTVPLRLWFDAAYRHPENPWDRHFHEFEDWQFDWLLEKAGWRITHREKWNGPIFKIGIRPLIRRLTPRYYAVDAARIEPSESE